MPDSIIFLTAMLILPIISDMKRSRTATGPTELMLTGDSLKSLDDAGLTAVGAMAVPPGYTGVLPETAGETLIYVSFGEGTLAPADADPVKVRAGDAYALAGGSVAVASGTRGWWRFAWLCTRKPFLISTATDRLRLEDDPEFMHHLILATIYETYRRGRAAVVAGLATALGAALRARSGEPGADSRRPLAAIWITVERDLARPWTLPDLADIAAVSVPQLNRLCQSQLDRSPMEQVAHLRMVRAAQLLRSGTANVEAAAQSVGYGSTAAFSRAFLRVWGHRPKAYQLRGLPHYTADHATNRRRRPADSAQPPAGDFARPQDTASLLATSSRPPAQEADHAALPWPTRADTRRFRPISLERFCNRTIGGTARGQWIADKPFPPIQRPRLLVHHVPYLVPPRADGHGMIVLRSERTDDDSGAATLPRMVRIPIGMQVSSLFFLHGCAWVAATDSIAQYRMMCGRDVLARVPVVALGPALPAQAVAVGAILQDWYSSYQPFTTDHVRPAFFHGRRGNAEQHGTLYVYRWVNPTPQRRVDLVEVVARRGSLTPLALVGLTALPASA